MHAHQGMNPESSEFLNVCTGMLISAKTVLQRRGFFPDGNFDSVGGSGRVDFRGALNRSDPWGSGLEGFGWMQETESHQNEAISPKLSELLRNASQVIDDVARGLFWNGSGVKRRDWHVKPGRTIEDVLDLYDMCISHLHSKVLGG